MQASHSRSRATERTDETSTPMQRWLLASANEVVYSSSSGSYGDSDSHEKVRFQIGAPAFGWSNTLWQVSGIQFATFARPENEPTPTFLIMCSQRAGSWYISATCLEDPLAARVVPAATTTATAHDHDASMQRQRPKTLTIALSIAEVRLHCCDEFDPVRDTRGRIQYPEIFRLSCAGATAVLSSSADPPESSRTAASLGYLTHVRAYSTLFVSVEDVEFDHFLQDCNFPVVVSFPGSDARLAARELRQLELPSKHAALNAVVAELVNQDVPLAATHCVVGRVVFVDTWDRTVVPAYFHSIEVSTLPAVLQVRRLSICVRQCGLRLSATDSGVAVECAGRRRDPVARARVCAAARGCARWH